MTAYARVITIGRNDALPKVVKIPVGVGVDGSVIRAPITIQPDEIICPVCKGWGEYGHYKCDRCNGDCIISLDDTEISAGDECLPPAGIGRPAAGPSAGRPLSSTSTVAARATGDLSCSISHHSPTLHHAPAALGHLNNVVEALTVIGGMAVFGAIGYLFLVLA